MRTLVLAACLVVGVPAGADARGYDGGANRAYPVKAIYKFWRGVENVFGAPSEIGYNVLKEGQIVAAGGGSLRDQSAGLSAGFFTGLGYMVARVAVGAFDVVTFLIPTGPLMDPATPETLLKLALDGPGSR